MNRKEEIILAALDIASESGLENLTMSRLAQKLGIQKPSLYNHFSSKEELIAGMYACLRERAKERSAVGNTDYGELIKDRSTEEVLSAAVGNYAKICGEEKMYSFYRLIYSRRAADPAAAQILAGETERMISETRKLFYALYAHNRIRNDNIDAAAAAFAMTVHALLDYRADLILAGKPACDGLIQDCVKWFCGLYATDNRE